VPKSVRLETSSLTPGLTLGLAFAGTSRAVPGVWPGWWYEGGVVPRWVGVRVGTGGYG